jgi:HK97 family phage portal protein
MTLADAEFLESRKFERTEIATLYRIPEVLLGNSDKTSSWGTGIETLTNGFLAFSLGPWLVNWEQALNFTLLTEQEKRDGYYFRFTRGALLQVALEAQAKFFREMRDIGVTA